MIKRLWNKWCNIVDLHNNKLDYSTCDERWDYTTIFIPFLFASINTLIVVLAMFINDKILITDLIFTVLFTFGFSSLTLGLCLFINWKMYD